MSRWGVGRIVTVVVLVGAVAGGCSDRGRWRACDATSVAHKVLPSVVTIVAKHGNDVSLGSGAVIRSEGQILTNNHVVSPAADGGTIEVVFTDGTVAPATITGRDAPTDTAVIKVSPPSSLPVIPFGSSGSLDIGEPVVALGAPLGLASTVTAGIVSALGRSVTVPGDNGQTAVLLSAVQTDAAINPGNSGGVLADCSGDMIGVPSAIATIPDPSGATSGSIGLGFAIPVDLAKAVSDQLIATGAVTHSYFGIEVSLAPPEAQTTSKSEGLYVTEVDAGGPSEAAGLQAGDVITEIEGAPATDPTQLALLTLKKKPGETVAVTYKREGNAANATITLGTPP